MQFVSFASCKRKGERATLKGQPSLSTFPDTHRFNDDNERSQSEEESRLRAIYTRRSSSFTYTRSKGNKRHVQASSITCRGRPRVYLPKTAPPADDVPHGYRVSADQTAARHLLLRGMTPCRPLSRAERCAAAPFGHRWPTGNGRLMMPPPSASPPPPSRCTLGRQICSKQLQSAMV